ncbi:MAG: hypothetical protein J6T14_07765 [Clostridia bacterium]|nr:hypothetical protein [Clostridia bacterium]MBO7690707.1 hypothetical protein [Clostridia bacterium]MBP5272392.1 hypothetical protein [Clostridia bacterium]MBP5460082.1 hypothetical protein [Clostridia bacterium]
MKDKTALESLDRQGLLAYIDELEAKTAELEDKMEDLKAQVDVLNMDMDEFRVPDVGASELRVSEQTSGMLAEAASIFDDYEVEPAPVENGVVRLEPVTETETYIPVSETAKKTVRVRVKRKTE